MALATCSTLTPRPCADVDAADECSSASAPGPRGWERLADASPSDPPRIESLNNLERNCCTNGDEQALWRALAIAAAAELTPTLNHRPEAFDCPNDGWRTALEALNWQRYELRRAMEDSGTNQREELAALHEGADADLTAEINFCFARNPDRGNPSHDHEKQIAFRQVRQRRGAQKQPRD